MYIYIYICVYINIYVLRYIFFQAIPFWYPVPTSSALHIEPPLTKASRPAGKCQGWTTHPPHYHNYVLVLHKVPARIFASFRSFINEGYTHRGKVEFMTIRIMKVETTPFFWSRSISKERWHGSSNIPKHSLDV